MPAWKRWLWPALKVLLALTILAFVGQRFYRDLTSDALAELTWRPGWLVLSGACYLAFLGTSAWYWRRLLRHFGQAPPALAAARAYYVSQLGKYVPGKALALVMRAVGVRDHGVRFGLAILTSFYEVLTTMAAGALMAALAFALSPPRALALPLHPAWAGLLLLAVCGVPLAPTLVNRLVRRLARRLQSDPSEPIPQLDLAALAQGLAATACGWALLGVAVWACLGAVLPEPPPLTPELWLECTGIIGLAWVGGFLAVFMPSGLGVREGLLRELLGFAGPGGLIGAAVLLMRVVWTGSELIIVAALYFIKPRPQGSHAKPPSELL